MKYLFLFLFLQLSCAAPEWRLKEVPADAVSRLEARAETVKRATVLLNSFGAAGCSGAFVSPELILTASHCVFSTINIEFRTFDAPNVYRSGRVVFFDPQVDVALVKVETGFRSDHVLELATKDEILLAKYFATIGHPMNLDSFDSFMNEEKSQYFYNLSVGKRLNINDQDWLIGSIPVRPGNSGGSVFNENGKIIGVISQFRLASYDSLKDEPSWKPEYIEYSSSHGAIERVQQKIGSSEALEELSWWQGDTNINSNFGFAARNSDRPHMTSWTLGLDFVSRFELTAGVEEGSSNSSNTFVRALGFMPLGNGQYSFRPGLGFHCDRNRFVQEPGQVGTWQNTSGCCPIAFLGTHNFGAYYVFGESGESRIALEFRFIRWWSTVSGY